MMRRIVYRGILAAAALSMTGTLAMAQAPTIDAGLPPAPGGGNSLFGPPPGGSGVSQNQPGSGAGTLGGRPGASMSRAPASIGSPEATTRGTTRAVIRRPAELPAEQPTAGPLDFPDVLDDEGPAGGLTLDTAIEVLVRENLYLRAAAFELPQAEADLLTASLRANPIFYADSQLIPYGNFSPNRPGGQTQYDVNISYPLDISHKRVARMTSAGRAKQVLEQQYRDAVRLQIDNLGTVYVDVLAARATLRFAAASVEGLDKILVPIESKYRQGAITEADYLKVVIQRQVAAIGLRDAEEQLRKAKRTLGNLLNIPKEQVDGLELRAPLRDVAPLAPAEDELIDMAMHARPDLAAYRLGVVRAEADVKLALANRYQDVYVLYQPYTFQDNQPNGTKSAHSWALGITVPLPIYNRNQGNIQRARLNVGQTQTQLTAQIRQVIMEVEQADREYRVSREAAEQFETTLRPYAEKVLAMAQQRYSQGEENLIVFLAARSDYVAIVRQYLEVLVRHRRAMLDLNTALGRRILP